MFIKIQTQIQILIWTNTITNEEENIQQTNWTGSREWNNSVSPQLPPTTRMKYKHKYKYEYQYKYKQKQEFKY